MEDVIFKPVKQQTLSKSLLSEWMNGKMNEWIAIEVHKTEKKMINERKSKDRGWTLTLLAIRGTQEMCVSSGARCGMAEI